MRSRDNFNKLLRANLPGITFKRQFLQRQHRSKVRASIDNYVSKFFASGGLARPIIDMSCLSNCPTVIIDAAHLYDGPNPPNRNRKPKVSFLRKSVLTGEDVVEVSLSRGKSKIGAVTDMLYICSISGPNVLFPRMSKQLYSDNKAGSYLPMQHTWVPVSELCAAQYSMQLAYELYPMSNKPRRKKRNPDRQKQEIGYKQRPNSLLFANIDLKQNNKIAKYTDLLNAMFRVIRDTYEPKIRQYFEGKRGYQNQVCLFLYVDDLVTMWNDIQFENSYKNRIMAFNHIAGFKKNSYKPADIMVIDVSTHVCECITRYAFVSQQENPAVLSYSDFQNVIERLRHIEQFYEKNIIEATENYLVTFLDPDDKEQMFTLQHSNVIMCKAIKEITQSDDLKVSFRLEHLMALVEAIGLKLAASTNRDTRYATYYSKLGDVDNFMLFSPLIVTFSTSPKKALSYVRDVYEQLHKHLSKVLNKKSISNDSIEIEFPGILKEGNDPYPTRFNQVIKKLMELKTA